VCVRQCARWQGAPQYSAVPQRAQADVEGAEQPSAQQSSRAFARAMAEKGGEEELRVHFRKTYTLVGVVAGCWRPVWMLAYPGTGL
jgi:hypothetical protein